MKCEQCGKDKETLKISPYIDREETINLCVECYREIYE